VLVSSFPAHSLMHSHCAAEQVLKCALLKTGGLNRSEYSGQDAHKLVALVERIKDPRPDVSQQRLKRLADGFEATRYGIFPPSGAPTLPAAAFGVAEADEAYSLASHLIEWARSALPLHRGLARQSSGSHQNAGAADLDCVLHEASLDTVGAHSAALASAEARARTAEQELERLKESHRMAQGSVEAEVQRERSVLAEQHLSEREDLIRQHQEEVEKVQGELQAKIDKLEKRAARLQRMVDAANEEE